MVASEFIGETLAKGGVMTGKNKVQELEKAKDNILKKIAKKVKADPSMGEEYGAHHNSHTSSSKHNSTTH